MNGWHFLRQNWSGVLEKESELDSDFFEAALHLI
jgi:hypothetical protein